MNKSQTEEPVQLTTTYDYYERTWNLNTCCFLIKPDPRSSHPLPRTGNSRWFSRSFELAEKKIVARSIFLKRNNNRFFFRLCVAKMNYKRVWYVFLVKSILLSHFISPDSVEQLLDFGIFQSDIVQFLKFTKVQDTRDNDTRGLYSLYAIPEPCVSKITDFFRARYNQKFI